jgi:hypothetical protein
LADPQTRLARAVYNVHSSFYGTRRSVRYNACAGNQTPPCISADVLWRADVPLTAITAVPPANAD